MNNFGKNFAIWLVIGVLLIALFNIFQGSAEQGQIDTLTYSDFMNKVNDKQVAVVKISGNKVLGQYSNGTHFIVNTQGDRKLAETLTEKGVPSVDVIPPEDRMSSFWGIVISWFPMLLFIGVWIFFMRQMQGGGGKAMGFGKSKARMMTEQPGRVTFEDVAGIEEAKEDVQEIVEFLRDPHKFQRLGGKIPKGVLLSGPPGTGKTLLARAIAGEANVPFFSISGSDFVEMFVGVGASRVRDMFEQGKKNAPCIIFIDEIDAVGRHRGAGIGGGNDEREQTLNQLLVEMDGFETNDGVILVAATNRPDVLDPALIRPGRFDRQVVIPNPDVKGREQILRIHMQKVPLTADVEVNRIARGTPGFSGADLANLVNEAALLAARKGRTTVSAEEFDLARDKIMMGAERRSGMDEEEKEKTAYHEAGHALCFVYSPSTDPIHKATILPRGQALGMVQPLPEKDGYNNSKEYFESYIAVCMGGRTAEILIYGNEKVTNGAVSDIKQATAVATAMVTEWGMSEKLGPLRYAEENGRVLYSEETANLINDEIRTLVNDGSDKAKNILTEHLDELHIVAKALIEYETLTGEEIQDLISGKKIKRDTLEEKKKKKTIKKKSSVPTSAKKTKSSSPKGAPDPQGG